MKLHLYYGRPALDTNYDDVLASADLSRAHGDLVIDGVADVVWTFGRVEVLFYPDYDANRECMEASARRSTGWDAGVRDWSLVMRVEDDMVRVDRPDGNGGVTTTYFSDWSVSP